MLAHIDYQVSLAGRLKAKIEVVTHDMSVHPNDAIAGFEIEFCADRSGDDFSDRDAAAANLIDCWRDCEFVH